MLYLQRLEDVSRILVSGGPGSFWKSVHVEKGQEMSGVFRKIVGRELKTNQTSPSKRSDVNAEKFV